MIRTYCRLCGSTYLQEAGTPQVFHCPTCRSDKQLPLPLKSRSRSPKPKSKSKEESDGSGSPT